MSAQVVVSSVSRVSPPASPNHQSVRSRASLSSPTQPSLDRRVARRGTIQTTSPSDGLTPRAAHRRSWTSGDLPRPTLPRPGPGPVSLPPALAPGRGVFSSEHRAAREPIRSPTAARRFAPRGPTAGPRWWKRSSCGPPKRRYHTGASNRHRPSIFASNLCVTQQIVRPGWPEARSHLARRCGAVYAPGQFLDVPVWVRYIPVLFGTKIG
jgi:hypothetical protein